MSINKISSYIWNYSLGNLELFGIRVGTFLLDGGAMFGITPKVLWEKIAPPDSKNRILLATNILLIKGKDFNIISDAGNGTKFDEKWVNIYGIKDEETLIPKLKECGLEPEDITHIIPTHLHFDHIGGLTKLENGKPVEIFKKAIYFIQKTEWDDANNINERTKGSYLEQDIIPIAKSNRINFVDGDTEVLPDIFVVKSGGHTPGHQMIMIKTPDETFIHWGDIIPTQGHNKINYAMAYDLFPLETIQVKKKYIPQAVENKWLCFWVHDTNEPLGFIQKF